MSSLFLYELPLIHTKFLSPFRPKPTRGKSVAVSARTPKSQQRQQQQQQQQVNLSVLRFTFGIPGLDESYLPRWIGYGFGSLLLLNHFLGSSAAPAQLRSEALGLSLAAFSIALPYFGRFLKGSSPVEQATLPEGTEQIFVMSEGIPDAQKEDLAWATYVLLRNTNSVAVLIVAGGALCVRGYWNTPQNVSKAQLSDWFQRQIGLVGFSELKDSLYFSQPVVDESESRLWKMVPKGTRSLLVEPLVADQVDNAIEKTDQGFVLLASSMGYAYNDKDRAWIRAAAKKLTVTAV